MIKEAKALIHVSAFHSLFQVPVLGSPEIPSEDRCQLRINLLQEELDELKEAIKEKDMVEMADALCDLQYVLSGAILEFGLQHRFSDLFDEVQRSNMSKACSSMAEAEATVKKYAALDTSAHIKQVGEKYLVYRDGDLKVLKSVDYSPANLEGMLSDVLASQ